MIAVALGRSSPAHDSYNKTTMGLDQYIYAINKEGKKILFKNPIPLPKGKVVTVHMDVNDPNDKPTFTESEPQPNTYRKYSSLHEYLEGIYKGVNGDDADFNCEPMPILPLMLEVFFRTNDPDFDTPNEIDYTNLKEEDEAKSEAYFFRNWNRNLLRLVNAYGKKGYQIIYYAWY